MSRLDLDAVVVGAGSAGGAAAWQLARRGLKVALLERRRLDRAGARWRNAIPPWMCYAAGIPRPSPPELRGGEEPLTLISRDDRSRFTLPVGPLWQVDMGRLVGRLHRMASNAGVRLFGQVRIEALAFAEERPVAIDVTTETGEELRLGARLFVDASGFRGALRSRIPSVDRDAPQVHPDHVCHAVQRVCEVTDRGACEGFLQRHQAGPGETLSWIGLDSGFSTLTVGLPADLHDVDLLAGSAGPGMDADRMLADFEAREPWVGRRVMGGKGSIPLRHPYHRLGAPGIALLGDAACMVYSAHGSGVGFGMIAARMLAEVVSTFDDPGSEAATWAYQARFARRHGGVLAAADLFRRRVQTLGGEAVASLMASGFVTPRSSLEGLEQRLPGPSLAVTGAIARGLLTRPRLVLEMAPVMGRMGKVLELYRGYPATPDRDPLRRWSGRVAALFGDPPDVS